MGRRGTRSGLRPEGVECRRMREPNPKNSAAVTRAGIRTLFCVDILHVDVVTCLHNTCPRTIPALSCGPRNRKHDDNSTLVHTPSCALELEAQGIGAGRG